MVVGGESVVSVGRLTGAGAAFSAASRGLESGCAAWTGPAASEAALGAIAVPAGAAGAVAVRARTETIVRVTLPGLLGTVPG